MSQIREIPKNAKPPKLNEETINLLTKLCFRQNDEINNVDLIFVLGNTDFIQTANIVRGLLNRNVSKSVVITGGMPKYEDSRNIIKSEAEIILDYIKPEEFIDTLFILEKESNNVVENVVNALRLVKNPIGSLCFVNRSQGAGRCYLTLRKYLPNTKIFQQVFESNYDGVKVGRDNWFNTEFGRGRVWGEFLRIKLYGSEKQTIEFSEVKDLINKIEELCKKV